MAGPLIQTLTRGQVKAWTERSWRLEALAGLAFPKQRAYILDPAPKKASLCSRRSGKSYGVGLAICRAHELRPGASSLYVGLTQGTSLKIMFKDILEEIDSNLKLGLRFNRSLSQLAVWSKNGSVTYFTGGDAKSKEMRKTLGQKYSDVFFDEAQDFTANLREAVDLVEPAVADMDGTIWMSGTPGDFIGPKDERQFFFAVTKRLQPDLLPDESATPGWSVHHWSALDNPHMDRQWKAKLDASSPDERANPWFRRLYLGQWVLDTDARVYRYTRDRNTCESMPALTHYAIGVDLGFRDDTAFSVVGWRTGDPTLYVVRAYKRKGWTFTQVADELVALRKEYPSGQIVVDDANRQGVEEMKLRSGLPLLAAEKTAKVDFIRLLNASLADGKLRVKTPDCQPLIDEWDALIWDERSRVRREADQCDNHLSDSTLYAWRYARNFAAPESAPKKPNRDSEAFMNEWWEKESREEMRRRQM